MNILKLAPVATAVALTGCVVIGSGNTTVKPGSEVSPSASANTRTNAVSSVRTSSETMPPKQKDKINKPGASNSASAAAGSSTSTTTSSAPVSTPKPTPTSRVIKEETTSKVEVISSRPVVGTDAEMGN